MTNASRSGRPAAAPLLLGVAALVLALLALPWRGLAEGEARPLVLSRAVACNHSEPPEALLDRASPAQAACEAPGEAEAPVELPQIGEMRLDAARGRYVAPLGAGTATLTLVPSLQQKLSKVLETWRVPWGATVMIEPSTGRVLAMAEYSREEPGAKDLALRAIAPAASVFKIVTSAALLEKGYKVDDEVCYHGGRHRVRPSMLKDDPRRDRRCVSLAEALGKSANVVFAKLADRAVAAVTLEDTAEKFLFNQPIPFVRPVDVSGASIPDGGFDLATTAAGFGDVHMSALHGALIASIVANGGELVPPQLVDSVEGAPPLPEVQRTRAIAPAVAGALAEMMQTTTTEGTARKFFRDGRRSPLHEVLVAGKTGSLFGRDPFRDYTWFVGFAPADAPKVAIATVIVNERLWRVHAPEVAHESLKAFFGEAAAGEQTAAR